jgi:pilus assembly protein CpaC
LAFTAALFGAPRQQATAPAQGQQTLHILVSKSVVINLPEPLARVLTSNPAVIETVATTPTQLVVTGKAPGASSLILWDAMERSQMLDVVVDVDIAALRQAIERGFPGEPVTVETSAGRVILSGRVSTQSVIDNVTRLASLYSPQVLSTLSAPPPPPPPPIPPPPPPPPPQHDRQIMLEVKFAEIDRAKFSQLGLNIISTGAANTIGAISTQQFGPPSSSGTIGGAAGAPTSAFSLPDLLNVFLFRPDLNLAVTLRDLEQKSLLQILAEPNLMALNGQRASFLAGGEFPFPIVQGGANVGAVTIQFRPFGVRLDFLGTIDSSNVIRLHVAPEVSTLDFANGVSISGFVVPAISNRRAETEIELLDGQSFGIAGLLDNRAITQMSKIAGIGDIPILGKLFRSKQVNRSNTELIVIVTPHIVDPVRVPMPAPKLPNYVVPFLDTPKFDESIPGNGDVTTPQSKTR